MRTVTKRADQMTAGTQLLIFNRAATIVGVKTLIERGELGWTGPVHTPTPYYWVELEFQWDAPADAPTGAITLEGNQWVACREEW